MRAGVRRQGAQLIVGAGTNDTHTTIARHEQLAEVPGIVASLAVVPYYVRPSEPGIVAHFTEVAERSPVPLVIYNVPYRTGRGLGAASLLELAAHPNVVGVKQAVGGIDATPCASWPRPRPRTRSSVGTTRTCCPPS